MALTYYDVIQNHLEYFREGLFTSLPAVVDSYDVDAQTVNVKVTVPQLYAEGVLGEPPLTRNVPVIFPSAGGGMISFPIEKGDTVLLMYSMRDMTNWKNGDGTNQGTLTTRTHNKNDVVAIVGLFAKNDTSRPAAVENAVKIQYKDSEVVLKDTSIVINTTTTIELGASPVDGVMKAQTYIAAIDPLLLSLATAVDTLSGGVIQATAYATYQTAALNAPSVKSKVE